jgi:hypothetical protein
MTVAMVVASAENGSVRISLGGEIDWANVAAVEEDIRGDFRSADSSVG